MSGVSVLVACLIASIIINVVVVIKLIIITRTTKGLVIENKVLDELGKRQPIR